MSYRLEVPCPFCSEAVVMLYEAPDKLARAEASHEGEDGLCRWACEDTEGWVIRLRAAALLALPS